MRVLIAARLSQDHEGQTGIESQDLTVRAWAERNGHTVVAVVADKKSGTVPPWERPNLKPWVTRPELMAQYDGIVAWRFDRLSRGAKADTSAIEMWAHEHGKTLLTEDGLVFPNEGVDGIRWDVTARIAHEEWRKASERYLAMQNHLRDQGNAVGKVPFGFTTVKDASGHKVIVTDPAEADAIRHVAEMILGGGSLREACAWLDAKGLQPRHKRAEGDDRVWPWHPKVLAVLLRSELLVGRRVMNHRRKADIDGESQLISVRTVHEAPAILDRATWQSVQDELDHKGHRRGIAPSETALLTGVAMCGRCGRPMYRINSRTTRKDGTQYNQLYYRCGGPGRGQKSVCRNMIRLDALEGWVNEKLSADDSVVIETAIVPGSDHAARITEIERDLRSLNFDDPGFAQVQAKLLAERKRLRSLPAEPDRLAERVMDYTAGQQFAQADRAERRRLMLDAGVRVHAIGKDPAGWRLEGSLARQQYPWPWLFAHADFTATVDDDERAEAAA